MYDHLFTYTILKLHISTLLSHEQGVFIEYVLHLVSRSQTLFFAGRLSIRNYKRPLRYTSSKSANTSWHSKHLLSLLRYFVSVLLRFHCMVFIPLKYVYSIFNHRYWYNHFEHVTCITPNQYRLPCVHGAAPM